jgi:putative aldouronate transport system substrate-binding protein
MKRTLVILLCLTVLSLSLFANGGSEEKSSSKITVSAPGVYPIVTEPFEMRLMVPQQLGNTPDWKTNAASMLMEEVTGVKVIYDVAPDINQARTLAIASGDLPDAIMVGATPSSEIMKYGPKGIFIALNGLIDEHSKYIKEAFTADPLLKKVATTPDGNIYGIPQVNDDLHGVYGQKIWINQGWLDVLGLDLPTTTEEFRNVLLAFKNNDPNGNGKADEIPWSGATNAWLGQIPGALVNAFIPVNENTKGLYLDKGKVKSAYVNPKYREALSFAAKLYKEGLIDPAAFTQTGDQLRQLGENPGVEILGATGGGWWQVFTINGGESGRYKNYTIVPPLYGPDGFRSSGYFKYKVNKDAFVITKAMEYPEIALKWADYVYSSEGAYNTQYGPEGLGWFKPEPGSIGINGKPAKFIRNRSQEVDNANWGFMGPRYQPASERLAELKATPEEYYDAPKLMTRLAGVEVMSKYVGVQPKDEDIMPPVYLTEEQNSEISISESAITTYVKESTVRFVVGELNINGADWDKYLAELEKAGLPRMIELYQAAYDMQF